MRASGTIDDLSAGAGHVCWLFEHEQALADAACAFLRAGVVRGERLALVADGTTTEAWRHALSPLGDLDALAADGALLLAGVGDVYGAGGRFDPVEQVGRYRAMTAQALDDGFAGLRVAADATAMVVDDALRSQVLRYELEVDEVTAELPMAALCAYDLRSVGEAARSLCAVHPQHRRVRGADAGFRLYHDGGRLCLAGEIDFANRRLLASVLEAAVAGAGRDVVVDVGRLDFIDAGGLQELQQLAVSLERDGRMLRLAGAADVVRRCCDVLGLAHLLAPDTGSGAR